MKSHNILKIIFLVFLTACGESSKKQQLNGLEELRKSQKSTEITLKSTPDFNADSAFSYIEKQVAFGPRVPNTPAHVACGKYLVQMLKNTGANVIEQDFEATSFSGTKLRSKNIIARFNPNASKRILLAAHWDSRPFADQDTENREKAIDGANDGASGVGILLEIMRILHQDNKLSIGVDVVLFDSEDYGQPEGMDYQPHTWCLGSQYWSKNLHQPNYKAKYGILLDMVGAKNAKFYKEGVSIKYASDVVDKVWGTAHKLGYDQFFIDQSTAAITDDHTYVNQYAKIPMIDIIQHDPNSPSYFGQYWHTHQDNIEIIDKKTLQVVGKTVLQVIYNESSLSS